MNQTRHALAWALSLLALIHHPPAVVAQVPPMPLAGGWRFQLDRTDVGVAEKWFTRELSHQIALPGILQAQGYGDEISTNTPWVLSLYDKLWFEREDYQAYAQPGNVKVPFVSQPQRHYLGVAWYQRDIEIPKDWEGRRVVLFLERTRWETSAWLDDKLVGTNRSLCTPHEFDFGIVPPGKHRLTVRVDNRMLMNYRPDAHAVSDSLGSTWNGIVGKIELRSTPPVWMEDAQVHFAGNEARLRITLGNAGRQEAVVRVAVNQLRWREGEPVLIGRPMLTGSTRPVAVPTNGVTTEFTCGLETNRWDEFSPQLQQLNLSLAEENGRELETRRIVIGLRNIKTSGQEFIVNGRPTMMRGTHHGGDFPPTGYPPCDVEYWRKLFQTCKAWGLNHVRFHSFCPPEAAFTAADEIGIYLQPEPGMWNEISPGTPMEKMLYEETERMIKYYGNHPSFALFSASNEAKGRWKESLSQWVKHFRERDPRRLYTPDTGWSLIDEPGPVGDNADYLAVHRIGQNLMRGDRGWFGRDYARSMRNVDVPNIVHENGQWCAYPDFDVIKKFTGFIRPGNFEIFRDSARTNGVLEFNKQFAHASGRFQLACYKEEVEAILRTPGLGGFQLLDLHDYTGQGTALVGVLDPFWEEKGYVKANEWRQFCSKTVPLARLTKRVFLNTERLEAAIEVAHYGSTPLTNVTVTAAVRDAAGKWVGEPSRLQADLAIGRNSIPLKAGAELASLPAPAAYELVVKVGTNENSWNFWLYSAQVSTEAPKDILVTSSWSEAEQKLSEGGKVLFLPRNADLDWSSPPLDRIPVFWNRLMNPQWGRMLGLWCDAKHPALAGFPTEENCDWQWTEISRGTRAVNIGRLPRDLKPIVAAIDDWNRNWKLAPVFEAKVGKGKLLVCSFDISTRLDERIVARQLRRSLLDYVAGDKFQPAVAIAPEQMRDLWFDTLVMRKLGANSDSRDGNAAFDGDPNTFWTVGGRGRGADGRSHPHALTISFTNAVAMNGVTLMNRQNDRDHTGDIRGYKIELSDDGQSWRQVAAGELPSTWSPQALKFARTETAKQLKLTALSGYGNDSSAALAEMAVGYAGPALPQNAAASVEYQRVRSTSSDVDEGQTTTPSPVPRP